MKTANNPNFAVHELKTWSEYFQAIIRGDKKFEIRKNDRNFKPYDWLKLREWDNNSEQYTDREITVQINYIFKGGSFGVEEGFCVMSISNPAMI